MKLIVGLGNPGKAYERTRHNAGFRVADELVSRAGAKWRRKLFARAWTAGVDPGGCRALAVKPLTYMNRSGDAVSALLRKRGGSESDLIVIFDDVELVVGQVRVRAKGGAGGHNGLQSVIARLGTEEFVRVRIGVGPRPQGEELVDYVLSRFRAEEVKSFEEAVARAADAVECILCEGVEQAMNRFNTKQAEGGDP